MFRQEGARVGAGRASVFVLSLQLVAFAQQPLLEQEQFDRDLMFALQESLAADPGILGHAIDASVEDGIVKLQGAVHSWAARERAARAAASFGGVRDVVNLIEVRTQPRPDAELLEQVTAALRADPAIDAGNLDVQIVDGAVTLAGPVESWGSRRLVYDTVGGVRGVRAVRDEMSVPVTITRTDAEIAQEVNQALAFNVWTDDLPLNAVVENGRILIAGTVPCCGVRTAIQDVVHLPGVLGVDTSSLLVDWREWQRSQRRTIRQLREAEIAQLIAESFRTDPRTKPFGLAAETRDGRLLLTGTVNHLRAKRAAQERARLINQVASIENRIRVRPPSPVPADHAILAAVEGALRRDADLERLDDELTLQISNGVVYLRGKVNSHFEAMRAEEVASGLTGVVAVENRLEVLTPARRIWPDDQVRDFVQRSLAWNPFVDDRAVTVMVQDGTVSLTGTVADRHAKDLAMQAALLGGARIVHNQIEFSRPTAGRARRVSD